MGKGEKTKMKRLFHFLMFYKGHISPAFISSFTVLLSLQGSFFNSNSGITSMQFFMSGKCCYCFYLMSNKFVPIALMPLRFFSYLQTHMLCYYCRFFPMVAELWVLLNPNCIRQHRVSNSTFSCFLLYWMSCLEKIN